MMESFICSNAGGFFRCLMLLFVLSAVCGQDVFNPNRKGMLKQMVGSHIHQFFFLCKYNESTSPQIYPLIFIVLLSPLVLCFIPNRMERNV